MARPLGRELAERAGRMRALVRPCGVAALCVVATAGALAQGVETLSEVLVHGNHTTPDAEVLALAGLTVGAPLSTGSLRQAEDRLRRSGRFAGVEVRKRFRSIDDPLDILVVVLVDEHAAVSDDDLVPGAMKRFRSAGMWLPILDYDDGYGFTYGARVGLADPLGPRSRVSVPLSWGGERRAAVEVDRTFDRGFPGRVEGALVASRRVNPHFDIADTRREARVRVERAMTRWLRAGGFARLTAVSFGSLEESHLAPGVDLVVDTRTDPAFPRNAVHATTSIEQLRFSGDRRVVRWTGDTRGYVGVYGSTVLALGAAISRASDPLPPYEQALLGGASILRGYDAGYKAGDNRLTVSGELRVPLTSPLRTGRFGVKAFVDAGTAYAAGARLADQRFDRAAGGGVFFTATVFRAGLDVAWRLHPSPGAPETADGGRRALTTGPRWHFGMGLAF